MANNDFKVGDRVRVYETCPYVGIVEKTGNDTPAFSGCILVRGIGNQFGWHHEKKCRRLRRKKRRIVYVKYRENGEVEAWNLTGKAVDRLHDGSWIKFREVIDTQKATK